MLAWTSPGIVISQRSYQDSKQILGMLSSAHGLWYGVGRRQKKYGQRYQLGDSVHATWTARLEEQLGFWSIELIQSYSARFMSYPVALICLQSACELMTRILPERHPYPQVYEAFEHLIQHLADSQLHALTAYCHFEQILLAEVGFALDLTRCAVNGTDKDLAYISPKTGRAVSLSAGHPYQDRLLLLPRFWREDSMPDVGQIKQALYALTVLFRRHVIDKLPPIREQIWSYI